MQYTPYSMIDHTFTIHRVSFFLSFFLSFLLAFGPAMPYITFIQLVPSRVRTIAVAMAEEDIK